MNKKIEKRKVPVGAQSFVENDLCLAQFAKGKDGEDDQFEMVAYSGGILKHWYWGEFIIDLAGMNFPKAKQPILMDHMTSKRIGWVKGRPKPVKELRFDKINFVDSSESLEFREQSKQGFPFQASISVQPLTITTLGKGDKATVNGRNVKGIDVWSKTDFFESSVVVFGTDKNTKSAVFAEEGGEIEIEIVGKEASNQKETENGGTEVMDLKELKEKHPELVSALTKEIQAEFTKKEEGLKDSNAKLSGKIEKMGTTLIAQGKQIAEFDKRETLRTEKDRETKAEGLWTKKLTASDVPAHLHEKVRKHVSYTAFVKDDVLDVPGFSAAVDAEIKDWEEKLTTTTDGLPDGHSFSRQGESESVSKEDADWEVEMLKLSGDTPQA